MSLNGKAPCAVCGAQHWDGTAAHAALLLGDLGQRSLLGPQTPAGPAVMPEIEIAGRVPLARADLADTIDTTETASCAN